MKNKAIGNLLIKVLVVLAAVAAVVMIIVFSIRANSQDRVIRKELTVEAGTVTSLDDLAKEYLKDKSLTARFSKESQYSQYNLNKVGTYHLQLIVGKGEDRYNVVLHVVDTIAPVAHSKPMLVSKGANLLPENLLTDIQDATAVSVSFLKAPDTNKIGLQQVTLLVEDEGHQTLIIETTVYVTNSSLEPVLYELGDPYPELSQFLKDVQGGVFTTPLADLEIKIPGKYYLDVDIYGATYSVVMDAVDTTAPVATAVNGYEINLGQSLPKPEKLVIDVFDATELTFEYVGNYTLDVPGTYDVVVKITDLGGNELLLVVPVKVLDTTGSDTEKDIYPPVISGAVDLEFAVGSAIIYGEGVTVRDARDGEMDIRDSKYCSIDHSKVRENVVGTYPVTYIATDSSGNTSRVTVELKIVHMDIADKDIYKHAGSVLNEIVDPSMNLREKIEAIYRYVYTQTESFTTDVTSDVNDRYTRQGYYGFLGYGNDAYAATGMLQVLFDQASIEYRVVDRQSRDFMHRWLLVDFGDGWFHVDALQNGYVWTTDGRVLKSDSKEAEELEIGSVRFTYEMTDTDLKQYTNAINEHRVGWDYYTFDKNQHPRTPERNKDGSYTPTYYTVQYITSIGGTITGVVTQKVAHGVDSTQVVAVPNYLYKFVRWDDGVSTPERIDRVNCDKTFKAVFAYNPEGVKFFTVKYIAGVGGYLIGNTEQYLQLGSESSGVTAVASYGYRFVGWDDGSKASTRTDEVVSDVTYTAIFEKVPTYILEYAANPGGSISGVTKQEVMIGQQGSAVTAVPMKGYYFVKWSDGVTTATRTDIADRTLKVAAEFSPLPTYVLTYLASAGGSIEGNASQNVLKGSESSAVTAVADEGYCFVKWSDGVTTATRTDVATGNLTVTAEFAEEKTVVFVDAGHGFANSDGVIDRGAGKDTAYTQLTGKYESDLNLAVAMKVKQILLSKGYEVIMSREGEVNQALTPTERAEMVNATNADIFVSIHGNTFTDESVKGARVYYSSLNANADTCLSYANTMAAALNATAGASLKKVGVHDSKNVAVIRGVLVPTVLVETCYMTSPEDAAMAATDAWISAMAEGICLGIVNQLNK